MNSNQTPEQNAPSTAAPRPAPELAGHLPIAFVAGFQIEELYCVFAEVGTLVVGGFTPELKLGCQRKVDSVARCLSWLNVGKDFPKLAQVIRQVCDQYSLPSESNRETPGEFNLVAGQISNVISRFMSHVRSQLNDVEGLRYDVGVFIARLSMCIRYICISASPQMAAAEIGPAFGPIYSDELKRTANTLTDVLTKGLAGRVLGQAFPPDITQKISTFASQLSKDETARSPDRLWALSVQLESLIGQAGFGFMPAPPPSTGTPPSPSTP